MTNPTMLLSLPSSNGIVTVNSKFSICVFSLVLAACTNIPVDDPNSPYSQIPVGSNLVLKRSIVVPADRFDALLDQADNPPAALTSDERETVCVLEMRSKQTNARTIDATEFRVTRVADDLYYTLHKPIQVAFNKAESPSIESHVTTLYLYSDKYPDVRSVRCEFDAYFGRGYPLSITTIRWALGGNFDLVIAKKAS